MAVHHIQHQRAIVVRGGGIEVGHISEALARILRTIDEQLQRLTLAVIGEELERIINGLQEQTLLAGEHGRDHVHQLRHVGDLDHVGVIHESVEEGGHHQGVFQVVALLQNTAALFLPLPAGAIPDVPLIPRNVDAAAGRLAGERGVDDPGGGLDAAVEFDGAGHKIAEVVAPISDVHVQREVVDVMLQMLQDGAIPSGPIGVGAEIGGARRDQLDAGVGPLHQLGGFQREFAVIVRRTMTHLPGTVHLIAQAPVGDFPGLRAAILFAQAGHGRILG